MSKRVIFGVVLSIAVSSVNAADFSKPVSVLSLMGDWANIVQESRCQIT